LCNRLALAIGIPLSPKLAIRAERYYLIIAGIIITLIRYDNHKAINASRAYAYGLKVCYARLKKPHSVTGKKVALRLARYLAFVPDFSGAGWIVTASVAAARE
jgi:hypothetical protein